MSVRPRSSRPVAVALVFLTHLVHHAPLAAAQSAPVGAAPQPERSVSPERSVRIDLLDNGDFAEANVDVRDARGVLPIPWWRSTRGREQIGTDEHRQRVYLRTSFEEWAEQPIAGYAPLISTLRIQGQVWGSGRLSVFDGGGGRADFDLDDKGWGDFEISGAQIEEKLGRRMLPRLLLRLQAKDATEQAHWRKLRVEVELPCPSESELRVEILALLAEIVEPWLVRGADEFGPRRTAFTCRSFDALTGETLTTVPGGFNPLNEQMQRALEFADVPGWRAHSERFIEDFLTIGLQPETGLPRGWDVTLDQPIVDRPAGDLALPFGFLIDLATRGPEKFRARAKAAAVKIGDTVLAKGLLPDGNVGASYFPLDATVNTGVNELRRLDVPAQLGRLSQLTGDPRYLRAASEALAVFEFAHYWSGTWERIDPGFDDEFGNYAARAATIALAHERDVLFKRFAVEGFDHYAPMWRDALRLGGNVAADQVRCWNLLIDVARLEPARKPLISELLRMAARSHFKGEQYGNGAWGDVTIFAFDPQTTLQVGDYTGAPQNLLHGLAALYAGDVGLRTDEVRAMYTAVLRSSVATYKRPYGFLLDRGERKGQNPASGTLRMLLGLVKMLAKL